MKKSIQELVDEVKDHLSFVDICYLLGYVLDKEKEYLFTHPEYTPSDEEIERWYDVRKRRIGGEPSAYITGEKEFYSLLFLVNRHTFIPRPETETLVEEVIRLNPRRILDIGTGSGNIAITVKHHLTHCSVIALDISKRALQTAEKNAEKILGSHSIRFIESNYFQKLSEAEFDVIASNPPYIKRKRLLYLQKEVKDYEPRRALDGGDDGLHAYRIILKQGKRFLTDRGKIVLEIEPELIKRVSAIAEHHDYTVERVKKDLSGADRVMVLSSPRSS